MGDRTGQQFGNYRLVRLLGCGGFAEVYLGEHIHIQKQVAIKVLSNQLGPTDLDRFIREAQTITLLEHVYLLSPSRFFARNSGCAHSDPLVTPSRTPGARRGNMPVWYPSKKMQCIIKAESTKVEFAFLLQAEHDDDVLEMWDQPPSFPLEYLDKHGRIQRPMHTADYFIFRYQSCGWIECKPAQELSRLVEKQPNRYVQASQGVWRCPPGEAFAAKYGLTYQVWSSDNINWATQENALFLEDYYQHLDRLVVENQTLAILHRLVGKHPGILLSDLQALSEISADRHCQT